MANNNIGTQLYKISFAENAILYRYNCKVQVIFTNGNKIKDLTDVNVNTDNSVIAGLEKRNACKFFVETVIHLNEDFESNQFGYAYDGVKNFISNSPLKIFDFCIKKNELGDKFKSIVKKGDVKITFEKSQFNDKIDLSNFNAYEKKEKLDLILNCLDLITTQQALNPKAMDGGEYIQFKPGKSLTESIISPEYKYFPTGPGRVIIDGFTKGFKVVNINEPSFAFFIDASKNVYYKPEKLDRIIKKEIFKGNVPSSSSAFNSKINDSNIKGVYVATTHRNNGEIFKFQHDLHDKDANNTFFEKKDGSKISIAKYFKEKFHLKLKYPEWPLFIHKTKKIIIVDDGTKEKTEQINYYPLEVLQIISGQQVPIRKLDPVSSYTQQRINTSGPFERKGSSNIQMTNLGVLKKNNLFFKFGIHISPYSNNVTSNTTENPNVYVYKNCDVQVENGKIFNKNKASFYSSPEIMSLVVVYSEKCNRRVIEKFVEKYTQRCKDFNINFVRRHLYSCNTDVDNIISENDLMQSLSNIVEKCSGKLFLIMIDDKRIKKSHAVLKVFEQMKDVLTQHITFEIASKCLNQIVTLDNIIRKTNTKLGGLNFLVNMSEKTLKNYNLDSNDVLYIGLDLSITTDKVMNNIYTSVGGWCANLGHKHGQYYGDYWYQPKKKDEPYLIEEEVLKDIMAKILKKWKQNKKNPPSKIIFFRHGLNDNQFQKSIDVELNYLLEIKKLVGYVFRNETLNCNFAFIFVTKNDIARFYSYQYNGCVKNVSPGTFISKEFTLDGHIKMYSKTNPSCLGTSKLPLYYLAYDENNKEDKITSEMLEKIINMLCYSYDIIPSAISIPAPAYIAQQFVKRGSNNLVYFSKTDPTPFQDMDYTSFSSKFNYSNKSLGDKRYNA